MFESVGWGEILVLALIGLFVLGPERLPGAIRWVADTMRTVREYAAGARDQLRNEIGPEFDEFRKPLEDLRQIRNMDPRAAVRRSLLDPVQDGTWTGAATPADTPPPTVNGTTGTTGVAHGLPAAGASGVIKGQSDRATPLRPGEAAPFDPDAT
ncbi:Sec-independent protein translocase protein TatB [Actinomycetospora sp. NBRC 106378]|uniref:Sec-independent protein translocase protein TatB n=1 Tax=Actinomycetospora sp. NBRC 106378 TaxID=3032208 RepID=UPI0024A1BAE6|nr:Sec-independent protein translocase protein TatB [Actinomycetospora sp. NBRC 106378]GLZ54311.1 sec-independent protein translocase protein TatB [Actinomycetospora sp. NBRC 106378]